MYKFALLYYGTQVLLTLGFYTTFLLASSLGSAGCPVFPWWDSYLRIYTNEPPIISYYFYWTNFFFLPAFFFLCGSVFLLSVVPLKTGWLLLCLITSYFLMTLEVTDITALNTILTHVNWTLTTPNLLLTNLLNRYHPLLLYTGIWLVSLTYILTTLRLFHYSGVFGGELAVNYNKLFRWAFLITYAALFGGSWWAFQEGTWGGWWNWDPSETFGLFFLLIILWQLHQQITYNSLVKNCYFFSFTLILSLSIYFFIQLNFAIVSHNFGIQFFYFFNNNLFLLEGLLLTVALLGLGAYRIVLIFQVWRLKLRLVTSDEISTLNLKLFWLLLGVGWFALAYRFLWHAFFYTYFNINTFNTDFVITKTNLIFLFFILAAPIAAWKQHWLVATSTIFTLTSPLLVYFQTPFKWGSYLFLTHYLLGLFFLINLNLMEATTPKMTFLELTPSSSLQTLPTQLSSNNVTLDSWFLTKQTYFFTYTMLALLISPKLLFSQSFMYTNKFLLLITNTELVNTYFLTDCDYTLTLVLNYPIMTNFVLILFVGTTFAALSPPSNSPATAN